MRFVCESCRAQYMINDEKVGPKGVKVRCRKCGYVITVKRTEAAKAVVVTPQVTAPLPMSNDPDDATATQVMQTPLVGSDDQDKTEAFGEGHNTHDSGDVTHPAANLSATLANATTTPALSRVDTKKPEKTKPSDSFLGADEDEIGAVFDQVLRTGPTVVAKDSFDAPSPGLDSDGDDDDRQSTRVIDANTVAQLARESGTDGTRTAEKKPEAVPETNWFVAINEKQTGPLTLDKVKEHWDRGEVGPDSLCWREGFADWIPLSEVKALASVLAPKPPKPIVVPTAVIPTAAASVVSVPVQSAFSAGGLVQTVQSEMQVPIAAAASSIADREESGSWRPSAASALASLVKDEMEALARPAPRPVVAQVEELSTRGLLDVPDEKPASAAPAARVAVAEAARPPTNPYMANPGATYSAPAVSQYRPQSNRNLIVGVAIGGGLLIALLVGLIIWVVSRPPVYATPVGTQPPTQPAVQPQPLVAQPVVQPVPPPVVPTPPATTPPPAATSPGTAAAPAADAALIATTPPVAKTPVAVARREPRVVAKADPPPPSEPKEQPKKAGADDDFDSVFGTSKPKAEAKPAEPARKKEVVIPPAPGGAGDVKESLGQSDIMEVVLGNRAALGKCAEDQHKREPGVTGKLVMKWTVQTNGKVSNVNVVTEEFRSTYMAGCVGGLVKGMVFPRHKQQGDPVQFPFKF